MTDTVFKDSTYRFINYNSNLASVIAKKINVSPTAILGAVSNEFDSRYTQEHNLSLDPANLKLGFAFQGLADYVAMGRARYLGHDDLKTQYNYIKSNPQIDELTLSKLDYPITIDVGPGNFRTTTAIRLLERYYDNNGDSDPLSLRIYKNDYPRLIQDLASFKNPTLSLKMAGLYTQEAENFYRDHASHYWENANQDTRDALVVTYYKIGPNNMLRNAAEAELRGERYNPDPNGDGGGQHLVNASRIRSEFESTKNIVRPDRDPSCFVAGTPILMADGSEKFIEQIQIGDLVMAFDPSADAGQGHMVPKRVTRLFTNEAKQIIDLRGLRCTPGHFFLSGGASRGEKTEFLPIASILKQDGSLVEADGNVVRARTGSRINSRDDIEIRVVFRRPHDAGESCVTVRAGIPITLSTTNQSERALSLAQWLDRNGIALRADGRLQAQDGSVFDCVDWPKGQSPLDRLESQNWVTRGEDEAFYTPPWIANLPSVEDEVWLRLVS